MKRSLFLCVFALSLGVSASAQAPVPSFGLYPAKVEKVRARAINFKGDAEARRFRTNLTEALKHGVDFAGHYVVATWGCGTACLYAAIVDTRTGNVFWPKELAGIYTTFDETIQNKPSSRLLIISQVPATKADLREDIYYEWSNDRLRLIRSVKTR